jgi:hypothetical protein
MNERTCDYHVECASCTAVIDLSVLAPERNAVIEKQALDELLVDYGWVPTSNGSYCPEHAAQEREKFRHHR